MAEQHPVICAHCGSRFEALRDAETCSIRCRVARHRARQRVAEAARVAEAEAVLSRALETLRAVAARDAVTPED